MEITRIEVGDKRIRGTDPSERKGLSSAMGDAGMAFGEGSWVRFQEYRGKNFFGRAGVRGDDIVFHVARTPFPAEQKMRELLAMAFMESVGTVEGIEASWVDTGDFEDYPSMWAIRVVNGAYNMMLRDAYLAKFLPQLEAVLNREM